MAFLIDKNLAQSSLASNYTAGNSSLTLQTGDGSKFSSPTGGDAVMLAVDNPPAFFLRCTGRSGDTLTVDTSGAEGTTAISETVGTQITQVQTAGVLQSLLAGAGGMALLEEHTASNSAALNFTSRNAPFQSGATFQSDFDEYVIEFVGLIPATNNVALNIQMSTNGGSSYDGTGIYDYAATYVYGSGTTGAFGGASQTSLQPFGADVGNTTGYSASASLKLIAPASTTLYKMLYGQTLQYNASASAVLLNTGWYGVYRNTAAVNALQISFSSGNITSGTVRIYGVRK